MDGNPQQNTLSNTTQKAVAVQQQPESAADTGTVQESQINTTIDMNQGTGSSTPATKNPDRNGNTANQVQVSALAVASPPTTDETTNETSPDAKDTSGNDHIIDMNASSIEDESDDSKSVPRIGFFPIVVAILVVLLILLIIAILAELLLKSKTTAIMPFLFK